MVNITCVCSYCQNHEKEKVVIEINFHEGVIYWICSECKKTNKLVISLQPPKLPSIKTMY